MEFQAGQFAYIAANAARFAEEPATIDVSMLECVMALSQFTTVQWSCADHIRSRHGNDFGGLCLQTCFPVKTAGCL